MPLVCVCVFLAVWFPCFHSLLSTNFDIKENTYRELWKVYLKNCSLFIIGKSILSNSCIVKWITFCSFHRLNGTGTLLRVFTASCVLICIVCVFIILCFAYFKKYSLLALLILLKSSLSYFKWREIGLFDWSLNTPIFQLSWIWCLVSSLLL